MRSSSCQDLDNRPTAFHCENERPVLPGLLLAKQLNWLPYSISHANTVRASKFGIRGGVL